MGYQFTGTSSQYMSAGISAITYPFTVACWMWCADNSANNGVSLCAPDKTAAWERIQLFAFNDGLIYFGVRGATGTTYHATVAYASATWLPVIGVATSSTSRTLYVGASSASNVSDTGVLTGLDTMLVGARWDITPSGPEAFFTGRVAEVVLDNIAWDAGQRAAYIAGTEAHKISGVTPDLYTNLIYNTSAPNGYGNNFTPNGAPTISDHPSVLTGQNKKRVTIAGIHADVVATLATYVHTPDTDYLGPDTLTAYVEDADTRNDTAVSAITVQSPPVITEGTGEASGQATTGVVSGAVAATIGMSFGAATTGVLSNILTNDARDVRPRFGKDMRFGEGYRFGKSGASDAFYAQPNG